MDRLGSSQIGAVRHMTHCHLNAPIPYHDELLYSAHARFSLYYNIQECKPLSQVLLSQSSLVVPVLLPARLSRLSWLIEDQWGQSLVDAALNYTVLPFYLVGNLSVSQRRESIICRAISDGASQMNKMLGITTTHVKHAKVLRYCADCVTQDRAQYGETYWHRQHQLPGVLVCPKHGIPLQLSRASIQPTRRIAAVAAEAVIDIDKDDYEYIKPSDTPRAIELSRCAQEVLVRSISTNEHAEQDNWKERLSFCGFDGKRGAMQDLQDQFICYWGESFIQQIETRWSVGAPLTWLMSMRQKPRKALHPTRRLLLEKFLLSLNQFRAPCAFGAGPWPCPNWLADHHNENVVSKYEDISDHRHPDRTIRRFSCDCGFIFTRYAAPVQGQKDFRVVDFGPCFPARAKELALSGMSTRAIASALRVDWKTADRFMEKGADLVRHSDDCKIDRLGRDKAQWISILEDLPGKGVKSLRANHPSLYMRLYRLDHDWLIAHSPKYQTDNVRMLRVDWAGRDQDLACAINISARSLLESSPHTRITRTALTSHLGCQSMVERNLHKLPLVRQALEEVCESHEDYRARRIKFSAAVLGPFTPLWRIVRNAGLRPELISNAVLKKVGLVCERDGACDVDF